MTLTAGSLFSGYGGLSLAVEEVLDADTVWVADVEPAANAVLARRFPHAPNLGDITSVDWSTVPHVGIFEGGSPCQDISTAGRRAGMTEGTRSNLWVAMREAIAHVKPTFVVWENVQGALSAGAHSDLEHCSGCMGETRDSGVVLRALGRVLGDLAELGFDAEWITVRASDVGACHRRARVFVLAWIPGRTDSGGGSLSLLPTPRTSDTNGAGVHGQGGIDLRTAVAYLPTPTATPYGTQKGLNPGAQYRPSLDTLTRDLLPTPSVADGMGGHARRGGDRGNELLLPGVAWEFASRLLPTPRAEERQQQNSRDNYNALSFEVTNHNRWGEYGPAIDRHAHMLGRPHPTPTITGARGGPKLSGEFTEWMMGLPHGWIWDLVLDGTITNNDALKMAGNGVFPSQAALALRIMLARAFPPEVAA